MRAVRPFVLSFIVLSVCAVLLACSSTDNRESDTMATKAADLTIQVADLEGQMADLEDEIAALDSEQSDMAAQIEELTAQLSTAHSELASAEGRYESLKSSAGDLSEIAAKAARLEQSIDGLEERRQELQSEIQDLNRERTPLIPRTVLDVIACTMSMEPKLTCLDSATWLENPRAEDIVVGSVIAFDPDCGESAPDGYLTAHRVLDIEVVDGEYYFWPKGDNLAEADGCWVPFSDVAGYILEVHKGSHPIHAELRDSVMDSEADAVRAWTRYSDLHEQYCGFPPGEEQECHASESELDHLAQRAGSWAEARRLSQCWYGAAADAVYFVNGDAPIYLSCSDVFLPY